MKSTKLALTSVVTSLLALSFASVDAIPPGPTLPEYVQKSELIVVGKLEPWETHQMLAFKGKGEWAKFRYAMVNIQVQEVLKGKADSKTVPIRFCVGYADQPELDTVPGQYQLRTEGVWVLSRDQGHLVGPCFPLEQKAEIVGLIGQPATTRPVANGEETEPQVAAFPYVIPTPYVTNDPRGRTTDLVLLFRVVSVATVPGNTGSRRGWTSQQVGLDKIEVVPTKWAAPFAGKPERRATVPEKWFTFYVALLNLAPGETFRIKLLFADAIEEFDLSYDKTTGLALKPVAVKFYQPGGDDGTAAHFGRYRQIEAVDGDVVYSCSNISLAARRGGKMLWQCPISQQFPGYGHPPESIELDGDEIILRTRLPKAGMSEPTVPFAAHYRKSNGVFVSHASPKKDQGITKQGDPDLKRKLERTGERR